MTHFSVNIIGVANRRTDKYVSVANLAFFCDSGNGDVDAAFFRVPPDDVDNAALSDDGRDFGYAAKFFTVSDKDNTGGFSTAT